MTRFLRTMAIAFACAGLSLYPRIAGAQNVSIPSLKAAFLLNFAEFAEWPYDAISPGRVFTFCVVGDKAVASALEQTLKQHPGAAPRSVVFVTADGPLSSCHVLYLGGTDLRQARRALENVKGAPIFTISDVEGFAELGGIAQLRVEKGQMRFVINPAAAQRAHIALSAKLLDLATLVKDGKNEGR